MAFSDLDESRFGEQSEGRAWHQDCLECARPRGQEAVSQDLWTEEKYLSPARCQTLGYKQTMEIKKKSLW